LGHVEVARKALRDGYADEVWMMVNGKLVNSPGEHKPGAAPLEQRLNMGDIAVRQIDDVYIYHGLQVRDPHSIATFRSVMRQFLQCQFKFIVGSDVIARLDRWSDVESVVKDTTYIVVDRDGGAPDTINALRGRLGSLGESLQTQLLQLDRYADVNSTSIRARIAEGISPAGLDRAVYRYIQDNGSYV
jgi:nicotinate (nicotinamide) nucleotide adenylyltransferase